jgi:hypothetical protein
MPTPPVGGVVHGAAAFKARQREFGRIAHHRHQQEARHVGVAVDALRGVERALEQQLLQRLRLRGHAEVDAVADDDLVVDARRRHAVLAADQHHRAAGGTSRRS